MGKPGRWLKNFLTGKKDKEKVAPAGVVGQHAGPVAVVAENSPTPVVLPPMTPKERRRWSFRRSSTASPAPVAVQSRVPDAEDAKKKHMTTVAERTYEEAAAVKIQSAFRSHLARKALRALRGLVKLQALVRGHMVRKRAKETLRCMQALVTAQARARARRLYMADDAAKLYTVRPSTPRKCNQEYKFRNPFQEIDRGMMEENVKIVEMDHGEFNPSGECRNSYLCPDHPQPEQMRCPVPRAHFNQDNNQQVYPAQSTVAEMSPMTCSGCFDERGFCTTHSSPQCYSAMSKPDPTRIPFSIPRPEYAKSLSYDYPFFPNYMANTESSRAKARSQSAPKQRQPDFFDRQMSRRRPSMEGRGGGVPRGPARMQRSSSQAGSAIQGYQYPPPPWSVKQIDRSSASLKGSECGSTTSTAATNTNYCGSLISFDVRG